MSLFSFLQSKFGGKTADRSNQRGTGFSARRRLKSAGFSLVEVSLAIGIMGFAFVAIFGLVPVGLSNFRQAKNVSVASEISERIFSELQDTPFTKLTNNGTVAAGSSWSLTFPNFTTPGATAASGTTAVRYFDDQGDETVSSDANAVFLVNVAVHVAPAFVVSTTGAAPVTNPALVAVTIQVAYSPGRVLPYQDTTTYLWSSKTTAGKAAGISLQVFNYNTLIAKNS